MDMPTFDELRDLAQRDPEGFEALRAQLIEDCICRSSRSNHRRLRGIQFVIDARRRSARSPVKALLDIQAMMYDSFLDLKQALLAHQSSSEPSVPTSGRILEFRRSVD
ncbi:DUF3135 domain-containing protein [Marinobacter zhanjiangensis]|uniref:DUF3135 domain-containing protein n=1 Tax=Marinobacter zhanjiangensis TaxID=578215 RepID=A0ABQ3AMQ8_9GAMM|nr:DUF3135 domain-containing protein [Marinobacter zhanjiangensis]GGY61247.1 hypothetical protein GCM10007071_05060 [Marinobacter zhanjiangensis]